MKQKLLGSYIKYGIGLLAIALSLFSAATGQATLIWDPGVTGGGGGGGAGAWNEVTVPIPTNWYDSTVPGDVVWTAGGDAEFDNTGGAVAVAAGGVTAHNITFNGPSYVVATGTANSITLNGTAPTITVNGSNTATFGSSSTNPGIIAGTAGLTKDGPGTLAFDSRGGSNTYTGGTTILAGTLQVNREGALGATPIAMDYNNIVMKQGATFKYGLATSPSTYRGIRLDGTGATATFNQTATGTLSWLAPITGTRGLNIITSGSLRLGNNINTYNGDTVFQSGTLSQGSDNPLPYYSNPNGAGTGNVYVWSGATIYMNNFNIQINGLNDGVGTSHGAGTVTQAGSGSRTLTLGDNNANGNFSGVVSGGKLSLSKIGAGTQILSGANNFGSTTGTVTTVYAGTLDVNGSIGGLTVNSGATFSPIGSILSSTSLNVLGKLNFAAGSTDIFDINSATAYDQLNVSVGASAGTVTLGGTLQVNLNYTPAATDAFWIINNDLTDAVNGTFNGLPQGSTVFTSGGTPWVIYYNADYSTLNSTPGAGNDVVIAPIPEPATLVMLIIAGGLCLMFRRTRNK